MKTISLIFLYFLQFSSNLFAQKSFFIEPIVALSGSFAQEVQKTPFVEKKNQWRENIGIALNFESNPNWRFSMGLNYGVGIEAVTGFQFVSEAATLNNNSCNARRCFYELSRNFEQISLQVNRKISKNLHFLPVNMEKGLHLFVFDVGLLVGTSLNILSGTPKYNISAKASLTESFEARAIQENGQNLAAVIGFFLQFKHFDKNTIRLSLIYNRGISDLHRAEINYQIGQNTYQHIMRHRGDLLSVQLSMPIRLIIF